MNISEKNELKEKILKVLDKIQSYLQNDGGDIKLISINDNLTITICIVGACRTCPLVNTLKESLKQYFKKEVPQIKEIINI